MESLSPAPVSITPELPCVCECGPSTAAVLGARTKSSGDNPVNIYPEADQR